MLRKLFRIGICAFFGLFAFKAEAYLQPLSPQSFNALYNLASKGDVSAINNARSRGLNIDSVNANGDTGLCVAAKHKNRTAFRSFLQSGANPSHSCTWKISGYRDFMQSVITNPVRNMDTAVPANKSIIKGMSLTTKALIGAGIVAAGVGVGMAVGGGGGGGGGDGTAPVDEHCTAYSQGVCTDCAAGYVLINKWCYKSVDCGTHGTQTGVGCTCDAGYDAASNCATCAKGYGRGSTGECVGVEVAKIIGNAADINTNYNTSQNIEINNTKYTTIYGLFYDADNTPTDWVIDKESFANAYYEIQDEKYPITTTITDYVRNTNNDICWFEGENESPSGYINTSDGFAYDTMNEIVGMATLNSSTFQYDVIKDGDQIGTSRTVSTTTTKDAYFMILKNSSVVDITNDSDSIVYGLYSPKVKKIYNVYVALKGSSPLFSDIDTYAAGYAISTISVNNIGEGDVYGIYGNNCIYSGDFEGDAEDDDTDFPIKTGVVTSIINVSNSGGGNAYGIYNGLTDQTDTSSSSSENAPGIYHEMKYNDDEDKTLVLHSYTYVTNTNGSGNTYGLYSLNAIKNSGVVSSVADAGDAYGLYSVGGKINNDTFGSKLDSVTAQSTTGHAYGAYIEDGEITNGRVMTASTVGGTGNAYGIYAVQSDSGTTTVTNNSGLTVRSAGGNAYGIYNKGGSVVNTTAIYPINVTAAAGTAYGIYSDGGTVENAGHIYVYGMSKDKTYGIYATNKAKVKNTGEFKFLIGVAGEDVTTNQYLTWEDEGAYCTNCSTLTTPDGGYAVYLTGGASFENAGSVSTTKSLSLGSKGVSIAKGGSFSANSISGNLNVANEIVSTGFENTYVLENAILAEDTSALTLTSGSPLFEASLSGSDIVMTKKDFADVVQNNSSVAAFLEQNYALQNNAPLFEDLKKKTNSEQVQNAVSALTAQDVLSRFSGEDLLMEKELNFDMSEKMFHLKDDVFSFSGEIKPQVFSGKNTRTQYALSGKRTENSSFGVGLSISDIKSDDGKRQNRRVSRHIQLLAPYKITLRGFEFLASPKIGYAYGTYNRTGYDAQSYEGKIEKRMAAVSNDVRYPVRVGAFELVPTAELNVGAYQTKLKENEKIYSLSSTRDETYSVETGVGAYLSMQRDFSKTNRFEFMFGASLYHEFANPYELELTMNQMNGRFKITDEKRRDNYIVLRSKFSYDIDNMSFYGNFLSYVDSEYRTRADVGFKYAF